MRSRARGVPTTVTTKIEWVAVQDHNGSWHRGYTFNPWWGCFKISPACAHCYAETWDKLRGGGSERHWGKFAPRRFLGNAHWRNPYKWANKAERLGVRLRVFCGSMCDWLESRGDLIEPRKRLLQVISDTPQLDWLMLSKRPENLGLLVPEWCRSGAPANVWLGVTAETQECADRRLPILNQVDARVYFVSAEPLLGPLSLREHRAHWVIVGSESKTTKARPTLPQWVAALRDECDELGRAFFVKQLQDHRKPPGKVVSLPMFEGRQHPGQPVPRLPRVDQPGAQTRIEFPVQLPLFGG